MSNEQQQVLTDIHKEIAKLEPNQQAAIYEGAAKIRAWLKETGSLSQIALALVGAELAAESERGEM